MVRIPGASEPAFWEMHARGEHDRIRLRFEEVGFLAALVAAFLGGV